MNTLADHFANRCKTLSRNISEAHPGQIVAWKRDGSQVFAVAPTLSEILEKISAMGVHRSDVVLDLVDEP